MLNQQNSFQQLCTLCFVLNLLQERRYCANDLELSQKNRFGLEMFFITDYHLNKTRSLDLKHLRISEFYVQVFLRNMPCHHFFC